MRIRLAWTVALALGWLAASPAPGAAAPKAGGTLVYATGTDALTLDPQFVTDVPTARAVMHIHETLVYQDDEGKIVPGLAESWSISADKLTHSAPFSTLPPTLAAAPAPPPLPAP